MKKSNVITRGLGLCGKVCLIATLIVGGVAIAFAKNRPTQDKWLSPVLRGGITTLNVVVSGSLNEKVKNVKVAWHGFMAGEREFSLNQQGIGKVEFEHCGTLCLEINVSGIQRTIDVIVNPGENVELQLDAQRQTFDFNGDYAELNRYLFYKKSEHAFVPAKEKMKGMTGHEYVLYCKSLYKDQVRELRKAKLGESEFHYASLEALLDCFKHIYSGYCNFEAAHRAEPERSGLRITCDDLKVLSSDIIGAGYDLMLFPENKVLPLLRLLKDEQQLFLCLGVNTGYLFDLYRTRSSAIKLHENVPLNDKCLEQLKYVSPEVADWFLRLNEKVEQEWQAHVGKKGYEIGKVPVVPREQVLDSILAGYRGEVVFVDFWYVYCRSCLRAMAEMEAVKEEYLKKGVKFLFITGEKASPEVRWLQMIPDMKGIHYRVTNEAYRYLIDEQFKMKGLPYYLIVDKQGNIKYRYNGFMGCEKMREILDEELSK